MSNRQPQSSGNKPLIGMLVNTLVIRLDLTGEPTFRELLQRLRRVVLEAMITRTYRTP